MHSRLLTEQYLNIQAKLVFPLAIIFMLVVVLSPLESIINSRIEHKRIADLSEIEAQSPLYRELGGPGA